MVSQENQDGCVETMETDQDQNGESCEIRRQQGQGREYANSRKGYWHLANSWVLSTTLTNERLRAAGYTMLTDSYLVAQQLN